MKNKKFDFSDPSNWVFIVVGFLLLRKALPVVLPTLLSMFGKLTGWEKAHATAAAKQQEDLAERVLRDNPQQYVLSNGQTITRERAVSDARRLHAALREGWFGTDEAAVYNTLSEYKPAPFKFMGTMYAQAFGRVLSDDLERYLSASEVAPLKWLYV